MPIGVSLPRQRIVSASHEFVQRRREDGGRRAQAPGAVPGASPCCRRGRPLSCTAESVEVSRAEFPSRRARSDSRSSPDAASRSPPSSRARPGQPGLSRAAALWPGADPRGRRPRPQRRAQRDASAEGRTRMRDAMADRGAQFRRALRQERRGDRLLVADHPGPSRRVESRREGADVVDSAAMGVHVPIFLMNRGRRKEDRPHAAESKRPYSS